MNRKPQPAAPTVVDYVGSPCHCSKCGAPLRDDHGYRLSDGTNVCVRGDRCSMRASAKANAGKPMRWRR